MAQGAAGAVGARLSPQVDSLIRAAQAGDQDRKSTRLNSSHITISYAVFCLKNKRQLMPHHASISPAGLVMLVAAIFSRRCATDEVPWMSMIVAECCSSHASENA